MSFPSAGLVSYWKLDEASGTRVDSVGTNHLTPTNAPAGVAGKIGNACSFEVDLFQYLSHPDPTPLGDEDFTYTLWFKPQQVVAARYMFIAKDSQVVNGRCYTLEVDSSQRVVFFFNSEATLQVMTPLGTISDVNWHFVAAWHNAVANTVNLQVDGGTVYSVATGGLAPLATAGVDVVIGARAHTAARDFYDGLIDEVGLWKRVLAAQERADLYNNGTGLSFAPAPSLGDVRKVGRLVSVRGAIIGGTYRMRPAVITAVGAGDTVTCRVGHGGEVYTNIPKWKRGVTPVGWVRS